MLIVQCPSNVTTPSTSIQVLNAYLQITVLYVNEECRNAVAEEKSRYEILSKNSEATRPWLD